MVHALQKVHRLLKPGGTLIECHYTGEEFALEVHNANTTLLTIPLRRNDDYEMFKRAKIALDTMVKGGLFEPVADQYFDEVVRSNRFDTLQEWLAQNVQQVVIGEHIEREVQILNLPGEGIAEVVFRRRTRIGRLHRT